MSKSRMMVTALLAAALLACGAGTPTEPDHAHREHHDEPSRGPHGGRLLVDGDFAVEVTIYERGVPPEFRLWAYRGDEPVDPGDVKLEITLRRFGGRVDDIGFRPVDDHLRGDRTVDEPHSFDVTVVADHRGLTHRWQYEAYEGRTVLSPAAIAASGIAIDTVKPATMRTSLRATGRIVPNAERVAHVIPRYAGVVKSATKRLGDGVARGEVLAVIEGNETLQAYEVRSPIDGTVIDKDVIAGELVKEGYAIYTIADLGTVWVDLNVHQADFDKLRVGQPVSLDGDAVGQGVIAYLAPVAAANTQTLLARAAIPNPDRRWHPGLFVSADILVEETTVPKAVKATALQRFRDWDVVFLTDGSVFQAMPVVLGRRDAGWVQVEQGVEAGQRYAADNSFIVKADVGKSGASHDH
jgi:cobalt-zinc-cadmium efflux system membrane fusion protein